MSRPHGSDREYDPEEYEPNSEAFLKARINHNMVMQAMLKYEERALWSALRAVREGLDISEGPAPGEHDPEDEEEYFDALEYAVADFDEPTSYCSKSRFGRPRA